MRSEALPEENTPTPQKPEPNPTVDRPAENTAAQQHRKGRFLLVQGQEMNATSSLENVIVEADRDGQQQQQQPPIASTEPAPTHVAPPPQSAAANGKPAGDEPKTNNTAAEPERTTTVRKGRFQIQQSDELPNNSKGIQPPDAVRRSSSVSVPTQKGRFQILSDTKPEGVESRGRSTSVASLPSTMTQQKGRFLVQVPSNETNESDTTEPKPREAPPRQSSRMKGRFLVQPQSDSAMEGESANSTQVPAESSEPQQRQPSRQKGRFTLNPPEASSSSSTQHPETLMGNSPIVSIPEGQQVVEKKGRFSVMKQTDAGDRLEAEVNAVPQIRKRGRFVVSNTRIQGVVTSAPQVIPFHQPGYGVASMPNLPPSVPMAAGPMAVAEGLTYTPPLHPPPQGSVISAKLSSQSPPPPPPPPNQTDVVPPGPPISNEDAPSALPSKARSASTPTSRPRPTPSMSGKQGFGKMLHYLDQMRLEVTDADRTVRTLQTDMKCMVRDDE